MKRGFVLRQLTLVQQHLSTNPPNYFVSVSKLASIYWGMALRSDTIGETLEYNVSIDPIAPYHTSNLLIAILLYIDSQLSRTLVWLFHVTWDLLTVMICDGREAWEKWHGMKSHARRGFASRKIFVVCQQLKDEFVLP